VQRSLGNLAASRQYSGFHKILARARPRQQLGPPS
jgi:hypothetical protein